jgi:hypothetical protein
MGKKFTEGNPGKPKGAVNKTTAAARELFLSIMEGEQGHIQNCLEKVRKKDPAKYLEVLSKFYPYFIPKKVEVDQKPTEMTIHVKRRG